MEALLPQSDAAGSIVEVLVIDDCSSDDTPSIVKAATSFGSFRYIRNEVNVGMSNNIVSASARHASGEYVWVLSQHNIMTPGAISRILDALSTHADLDAFYVNFRVARYPSEWPSSAMGGYDGPFHYIANTDLSSHMLARWEDILDCSTSVGTQTYVHIVRRKKTVEFWGGRSIATEFTDAIDTYAQTFAVAHVMFGKPAFYIGAPVMTIYDGASTWGAYSLQANVYLRAYPDLLDHYVKLGWNGERVKLAEAWGSARAEKVLTELFTKWTSTEGRLALRYLFMNARKRGVVTAFLKAVLAARGSAVTQAVRTVGLQGERAFQYFAFNWRPARWLRSHRR